MTSFKQILNILPSALVSHAMGRLSDVQFNPSIQKWINQGFVHAMNVNMDEATLKPNDYPSLNALFTRAIHPETRPISNADVVSPVDGKISFAGKISSGTLLHAKGREYNVKTLTAIDPNMSEDWLDHAYAFIIYLAPYNYHRIHAPHDGTVTHMTYAPGRLLPVNRIGYWLTNDLLPTNERLTSFFTTPNQNRSALVKVGATCVGRISVKYDDFITNGVRRIPFAKSLQKPWHMQKGDELGCFELGSTVVLLLDGDQFIPNHNIQYNQTIKLGDPLGNWK